MYTFLRGLMRLVVQAYLVGLFRVSAIERMPRRNGLIVCANHASTIDPPLLPAFLPRGDTWSMAKAEWFNGGVIEWLFTAYHAFPVVRHSPDRRSLRRARSLLESGGALVIYPEGRRVDSGQLATAEPGAGFLARTAGVPVAPVALVGTNDVFPRGVKWPRRRRLEIRCGEPILIRDRRPDGSRVDNQEAADAIMLAIARLLPEELRGEYRDLEALEARLGDVFEPLAGTPV